MISFVSVRAALGCALLLLLGAGPATAQWYDGSDARGLHATRAQLEHALAAFEQRADESGLRDEERIQTRAEADMIRARLEEGDFRVGDQVTLYVEGHPNLSNTYTLDPTRSIEVPGVGSVPLRGVLRSELEAYLTNYLGEYVRSPRVRAQSTIRVMVLGGVGSPGFYSVPSHALITDVIESAGGTGRSARLTQIRIERDGRRVLGGKQLQDAIIAGRTLDQLSVRAGDRIVVPERSRLANVREVLTWVTLVGSATWAVIRLTRGRW